MSTSVLSAQDATPTTQPAAATQPSPDAAVMYVGDKPITNADIDGLLPPSLPAEVKAQYRKRALGACIQNALMEAYLAEIPYPQEEVDAWKVQMTSVLAARGQKLEDFMAERKMDDEAVGRILKLRKLEAEVATDEKVDAFVKEHPSYFDGTKVQASHILITCESYAPAAVKAAYRERLAKIGEEIKAGKIDFAEAAKAHSGCPSAARGGDLGEFEFSKMVPPFAEAAFDTKVGEMSDIVESSFGFHLIKVTGRTDGSGEASLDARVKARSMLLQQFQDRIYAEMLAKHPVRMVE